MLRTFAAAAGLAIAAGAASAAFQGLYIEDVTASLPAAQNIPAGTRVFRMYAEFDGPGTTVGSDLNTVLSIGNSNPMGGTPLNFGIHLGLNPGANFLQATAAQGGSTVGGANLSFENARAQWDTYLSIGVPFVDPDEVVGGLPATDDSSPDPDFAFLNSDGISGVASFGTQAGHDTVQGGWFNANPPSLQGSASLQNGRFLTFLGQFSMVGLADGAQLGSSVDANTYASNIFRGELTVNVWIPGGADPFRVEFVEVPTPGALALFGVAGLAGFRRRR